MSVTAVVVTWNSGGYIEACLKSLLVAGHAVLGKVVVVDNASADDTLAAVRRVADSRIHLIQNSDNVGFARAVNQGLEACSLSPVLLLNPDTVMAEGALEVLLAVLALLPHVGIVAPRLVNLGGERQPSLVRFPTLRQALASTLLLRAFVSAEPEVYTDADHARAGEVEAAMGACLLLRPQAIAAVGPLATWSFMYGEDLDYCYRAAQTGWATWYADDAQVCHHSNASAGQVWSQRTRLRRTFAARQQFLIVHHGRLYATAYKMILMQDAVTRLMLRLIRGNWSGAHESLAALAALA